MPLSKVLRAMLVLPLAVGCSTAESASQPVDIAKVFDVKSVFGPDFKVTTLGPTGIDPQFLSPQKLPDGLTFDPADCAKYAAGSMLPLGLKGNMAAVSAEGNGNRFIAIAVETSEPVTFDPAIREKCRHVVLSGGSAKGSVRGIVDVVDAPHIDDVETVGTHRTLEATLDGKSSTGELYNYVAYLGDTLVLVTANPLVVPGKPVAAVDVNLATKLLTDAVAAVRG